MKNHKIIYLIVLLTYCTCLTSCESIVEMLEVYDVASESNHNTNEDTKTFNNNANIFISDTLKTFTENFNKVYLINCWYELITDENYWVDYGEKDNYEILTHEYKYFQNKNSYLSPSIEVNMGTEIDDIYCVLLKLSIENMDDNTISNYERYFKSVTSVLIPDISDDTIKALYNNLTEDSNENFIYEDDEIYPIKLYYKDELYCYSYFKSGYHVIFFGTDIDKIQEYIDNGVYCIEII